MDIDNNLNNVPDQIDSFISSDTEPDATEFSDTLDVLDNTFKNVKYQKIKDILLEDIKKDVCDLIQNEIRQKINLYSQDEHQTLLDKRIIANLEEIHFLKTEIETKNVRMKNFVKMILTEMRITMYLKMGKFECLHTYQMSQMPM